MYQGNEASDDPVIYSSSVFEMKRYQRLQMSCFHQLLICGHRVKRHKYTELSCFLESTQKTPKKVIAVEIQVEIYIAFSVPVSLFSLILVTKQNVVSNSK